MIDINRTQREVLRDFIMHVEHILDPEDIYGFKNRRRKNKVRFNNNGDCLSGHDSKGKDHDHGENKGDEKDDKSQIYDWFKVNADELLGKASKRIEELEVLKRTAQSTSNSVSLFLWILQWPVLIRLPCSVNRSPRSQTTASQRCTSLAISQTI